MCCVCENIPVTPFESMVYKDDHGKLLKTKKFEAHFF